MSWPLVKLSEVVDIKGGGTPSKSVEEYWGGDIPWASVKDFKSTVLENTVDFITQLGVKNSATNVIPAGSIVVPSRMAVGKVAMLSVDMAINQDLKALLVKDDKKLDKRFLLRFLESQSTHILKQAKGATVKGITLDVLQNLEIPLPYPDDPEKSLKEQKRIAAILDKADGIRRKRKQAIQLADDFLRSVFLNMSEGFGAVDVIKLGSLCEIVRGSSPRPAGDPRYYGGNVPRLMVRDLSRDGKNVTPRIDFLTEEGAKRSRPMMAGEMVIAVSGQPGMPAILSVDACIHDGFAGLRDLDVMRVDIDYLYSYLISIKDSNANSAVGAIFKNLNTDQLKALAIPLPSITKQRKVSRVLSMIEDNKNNMLSGLKHAEDIVNSLSQKLFEFKG